MLCYTKVKQVKNVTGFWNVDLSKDAKKQYIKLNRSGDHRKPSIIDLIDALVVDLKHHGPVMNGWPNYGVIDKGRNSFYHCHLRKGKPTYVACWIVINENKIEVFYVGTHEGAPY